MSLYLLALLFTGAGVMHLIHPQAFIDIVPPFIPAARILVFLSGVAEITGAVGILVPLTRPAARWGLVALLVAVFPANIYMAVKQVHPGGLVIPAVFLWVRLPLQPLLVWWVIAATRAKQ